MRPLAMAENNPFDVIRDAISDAQSTRAQGGDGGSNAETCARAVLLAIEHAGFQIVRHVPEPADDEE
jgi:hypothetical protein